MEWGFDIDRYYKSDSSMEFMLQEVAGELVVNNELPSNLKWPLKVSSLVLNYDAKSRNNDFSQIKAEEIRIFGFQAEELIITEPSVLEWYYGSIKTITGITGTRLKRVILGSDVRNRIKFNNVTRLDSLIFNKRLYPTFSSLTHVNNASARHLMEDLTLDIQSVGKLDITTGDYSGGRSILLNNLETADEVTIASHKVKLFSAPKLMYGRLEIKHATELNMNKNLRWNETSFITSDDFCEKYFKAFKDHGLAFKTDNRCEVDCKQPYTPMNLASYTSCKEFKTIEINQKSVENIPLHEAATITSDLIITNYNGILSVPKLAVITGNFILTNSLNFSFSAPKLKKIQGSITIQDISSFSAPSIKKFQGSIILQNSSSFSAPSLKNMQGDLTILDSSSFHTPKLKKIQGSIIIYNSTISASSLEEVRGSISIKNSNNFSFAKLKKIKGDLNVTNSNTSSRQALYHLKRVRSIELCQQTNNIQFKSLKASNKLRIYNSSLISITGIDVTRLSDLTIKGCPRLNYMPLLDLKVVTNVYISSEELEDISHIFLASFNVTNQIIITKFQYDQMHLHLLDAGQLTLKDNPNLEVLHLKAEHLNSPLKFVNNPNLSVVKFKNMKINYKLKLGKFKGNIQSLTLLIFSKCCSNRKQASTSRKQ
ncbi:hypothetical protein DSO57_1016052 [Entomophthora muscae]|uniref:Uncharacterized protein n=1 Tax=Entomophthora muscae TaxID=34485 RepID=A0ACC2UR27_9FUNG|nr:hypothetical protein DSO57_1016052 [Entomophthora muscae]